MTWCVMVAVESIFMRHQLKIHRNIYLLGLLSFFNDVSADMVTPLLPVWVAHVGLGAGFLGIMEGLANFVSHGMMLFSGWVADKTSRNKRLVIMGYGLSSVARLFLAFPLAPVLLAARLVDRMGKGIRTAPRDHLITHSISHERWGEAFGIQRAMDHGGALVGTLVATFLLSQVDVKLSWIFMGAAVPALLSVLFLAPRIIEVKGEASKPQRQVFLSWSQLSKPVRHYIVVIFLAAATTPSELFLILQMQKWGLQTPYVPLAWLLMTLMTLLAAYVGGRLGDSWSRRRTMALGWGLFIAIYLGFAWIESLFWGWMLLGCFGIQSGLVEASERAYMAKMADSQIRAQSMGWYYFAYGLGLLPASLVFGLIYKHLSPAHAFVIFALLTFIPLLALKGLPSDRGPQLSSPTPPII